MIVFVPCYDGATWANFTVARTIPWPPDAHQQFDASATRANLLQALATQPQASLFAMSHGLRNALRCASGDALTLADGPLLQNRVVYAYACWTANGLGRDLSRQHHCIWWGYTGAIAAPSDEPTLTPIFADLFLFISQTFCGAPQNPWTLLDQLRVRCDQAEHLIDDLAEQDPDLDTGAAQLALLHLWDRLRVWYKGWDWLIGGPIRYPEASSPMLVD